jgi:PAS domain S-box-containing protein
MEKMKLFPKRNPDPIISVGKDGRILYSNGVYEHLLRGWGMGVEEKLPPFIIDFVQGIISRNKAEEIEVKVGNEVYIVSFHPLPEEECVNIYGFDINNQKDLNEKVQESGSKEIANVELAEIIDIQTIQSLIDDFYELTHIPIGLRDLKNIVLAGAGFQDICSKFHRAHPETCKHCIESIVEQSRNILPGEYKLYRCKNNMWDILTPIMVSNQHVGNIIAGQFIFDDEPLDYELFRSQARKYGFNEEEYITALEKVPRLSRKAVDTALSFFMTIANILSQLSYSNNKLAQSLAEREALLEALSASEEKYRNIVETANEGISIIDAEERITFVNKKIEDMLGYSSEELIGRSMWDLLSNESKAIISQMIEKGCKSANESFEIKLIRKDGYPIWMHTNSKSLFDKDGKFIGALNLHTDITKRKEAEEALMNLETSRKKEIHHRIKNNLQVISSLLDLQAEMFKGRNNIRDSEVLNAFAVSIDRVLSIALIHEELYKGENIDVLNFSQYIKELADNLLLTYRLETDVSLNLDLEENLFLDMDTAIPLGIIINELVSNSLKYAFPDRDKGEIRIKLHRYEIGECKNNGCKGADFVLIVSDDGIGIPENLDIEELDSLGLQLITSLVDQLDGELELKRDNGTEFTIRFSGIGNEPESLQRIARS